MYTITVVLRMLGVTLGDYHAASALGEITVTMIRTHCLQYPPTNDFSIARM